MSSKSKLPFSQYSSSSSSSQHKGLVPLTYEQQQQQQQNQRGWLDNHQDVATFRRHNIAAAHQLELMTHSSPPNNDRGDDADDSNDDHLVGTRDSSDAMVMESQREHMFDKVVTPSDVGKLNRLVIPKQHAEKYFPLDSSTNDKGLLLNFEDRNGKPWRFRYSYWNSSQSYVMTKGWSRFVKEKKLDAGDIVSFQRGVGELCKDRLFIDWRRRLDAPDILLPSSSLIPNHSFPAHQYLSFHHRSIPNWNVNPLFLPPQTGMSSISLVPAARGHSHLLQPSTTTNYPYTYGHGSSSLGSYNGVVNPCSGSVVYFRSAQEAAPAVVAPQGPQKVGMLQLQRGGISIGGGVVEPMVFESVPVVQGKVAAKRLRLFGVNLECPILESDGCDILSSTSIPQYSSSTMAPQPPQLSSSLPPFQLTAYNSSPLAAMHSGTLNEGKASMSLDLDI
ncbi:unnamed protein product [Ilex paraguariensis]|uniref:TF-B3 domain-containing protein n=1 Tax=Ilex paraguariensis TaxID=185542 RepID=A0ABC8TDP3_9AQUA